MIISRRYGPFVWLASRDPQSKAVLENAYANSMMSKSEQENHWNMLCTHRVSVNTAEMGACIPEFGYIIDEFERLDKEYPYDNGFTMRDVNRVDIVDQSPDSVHLCLYNEFDGDEYIIGFATIRATDMLVEEPDEPNSLWLSDWA
jgi:hypothetical protein